MDDAVQQQGDLLDVTSDLATSPSIADQAAPTVNDALLGVVEQLEQMDGQEAAADEALDEALDASS